MKTGRKDRSDRTDKTDRTDLRPGKPAKPGRRCWCCGSRNVYPERGAKGAHWWVCDDCGEGC